MHKSILTVSAILSFGALAIPAAAEPANGEEKQRKVIKKKVGDSTLLEDLRAGGYVLLMRHANSPSGQENAVALSENCILAKGRGLDTKGVIQSRLIHDFLAGESIPVAMSYSSDRCRTVDTAKLVAPDAPTSVAKGLALPEESEASQLKDYISTRLDEDGGNILLVSHSNIVPFYGATTEEDEEEVPSGALFIIDPENWAQIARLDVETQLEVKMKIRAKQ